jgi:hypothetical protein
MKTKRKIGGENWELDGSIITVRIPLTWKRRGSRKVIIAPGGGDAWAPTKPRPDETLIRRRRRRTGGSYDVERGLGMLRVVLNCGIFGLVVHIL